MLRNNGGDDLALTASGSFTFATPVASGSTYNVTILSAPVGETCTVTNGTGPVGSSNVTTVQVSCSANSYTVGGTLSGLIPGRTLLLRDNGSDSVTLSTNGTFTFANKVADQNTYNVTVFSQPVGQTCTVVNNSGSGTIDAANVTTVSVTCVANAYTIGGTLSSMGATKTIVLRNNGGDDLTLTANGAFTFSSGVLSGGTYAVSVATPPTGETCNVSFSSGTVTNANVTNVSVFCSANPYTVGGTIPGLGAGKSVYLRMSQSATYSFSVNGPFTMPGTTLDEGSYAVSIAFQPSGQLCTITNGSGTVHAANVTDIAINCVPAYTIGGNVKNLGVGDTLVLQNNGGETTTVTGSNSGNLSFSFPTPIADGGGYAVTVSTQPAGKTCSVVNGTGNVSGASVTNVAVSCSSLTINISASDLGSGTVTGIYVYSGPTLVALQNNFALGPGGIGVSNLFGTTVGQQGQGNNLRAVLTPKGRHPHGIHRRRQGHERHLSRHRRGHRRRELLRGP